MTLLLALSLACRPTTPPEATEVPNPPEAGPPGEPAGPPTPPPPAPEVPAVVDTTWSSASCHEREYERRVTLGADNRYQATDLVSPCPPEVTCIWSGVVNYGGTWAEEGGALVLTEELGADADKAVNRPTTLTWTDGQLTEPHEAGDCVYAVAEAPKAPEAPEAP